MAVRVSEYISEDMMMGRDIPHFRLNLQKVQDVEPEVEEESTPPTPTLTKSGMAVTRAQQLKQNELMEKEQQDRDQPVISAPYLVEDGSEAEADEERRMMPRTSWSPFLQQSGTMRSQKELQRSWRESSQRMS